MGQVFDYRKWLNKSIKFFIKIITRGRAAVIASAAFFGKKSGNSRERPKRDKERFGRGFRERTEKKDRKTVIYLPFSADCGIMGA